MQFYYSLIIWMNVSIGFDLRYQRSLAIKKVKRYVRSLRRFVKPLSSLNNRCLSQQHWTSNKARCEREWKRAREKEGTRLQDAADWRFATWSITVNVRVATQYAWECVRTSSEHAWQTRPEVRKHLNLLRRSLTFHWVVWRIIADLELYFEQI